MRFEHALQHTKEKLAELELMLRAPELPLRQALFLAQELVAHGHRQADVPLRQLRAQSGHADVQAYCTLLEQAWQNLRRHFELESVADAVSAQFYRRDGFVLCRTSQSSRKLLVIFTTIYNNFAISTLALAGLLQRLGVNLLILKDATRHAYHRGVEGFADTLPGIAGAISRTADQLGADRIYVSGFSSGGYPALLTSLHLKCAGYLGFSHMTDLSAQSPLPQSRQMPPELRNTLDQRYLCDLRPLLENADPAVPRRLVYGARSPTDVAHARHCEGLGTLGLTCLPDATHNTPLKLLANGRLDSVFEELIAR